MTAAAVLLLSLAGGAHGQTSADLTFTSEYTARGVAFGARPALQLRVDHDSDAGWYAGGFGSPVTLSTRDQGQLLAYAGFAHRLASGLAWDAGISRTVFTRDREWNYHEFYAGVTLDRVNARIFYSPAYYGEAPSAYLDLNGALPLGERLRLAAHAGMLHPFETYAGIRASVDARLALVAEIGDCTLQVGLQAQRHAFLPGTRHPRALTASASLHF